MPKIYFFQLPGSCAPGDKKAQSGSSAGLHAVSHFMQQRLENNNNNNNNNNNEPLFHQKIKLHILCYNNTEDKKTMTKKYLHTYIFKKYVITINGA